MNSTYKKDAVVIIDVQPEFSAASGVVKDCISLVQKASKLSIPVVFVEFGGETYPDIVKHIRRYRRLVKKYQNGASVLSPVLKRMKVDHIYVAGVNIDQCVHDTVLGLMHAIPYLRASLVKPACDTDTTNKDDALELYDHKKWESFKSRKRFRIINNIRHIKKQRAKR